MNEERLGDAYVRLFPRPLRDAHLALVLWAEEHREDGWPRPADVEAFAKLYRVPRHDLAALVGMLTWQPPGLRQTCWVDSVRERLPRHLTDQFSPSALRAYGWFLFTVDLGWLQRGRPQLN